MPEDKLELLKKLTRLANNNPNDNEANLAARKVCKLLEELKWALPAAPSTVRPTDKVKQAYDEYARSRNPDPFAQGSWSGFGGNYGSRTQQEYQEYQEARANEHARYYEQQARAQAEEYIRQEAERRKARADEAKDYDWFNTPKGDANKDWTKTGRRPLTCKTCGKEVETGYVGPKSQFECFRCQFRGSNP